MNYSNVIATIERPSYRDKEIKKYQSTNDIIKDLIYCFKKYNYQAEPVSQKYYTGNIYNDSKKIYDFIRKNIRYNAEPEELQTTKSFSRIIFDAKDNIGHDCKHSALIVSCIGWQMGYNVIFRFVCYDNSGFYGHVYCLLENPKTGEQIAVDPLQPFNYEKPFIKHKDYIAINNISKIKNMGLSRLTGIPVKAINNRGISIKLTPNAMGIVTYGSGATPGNPFSSSQTFPVSNNTLIPIDRTTYPAAPRPPANQVFTVQPRNQVTLKAPVNTNFGLAPKTEADISVNSNGESKGIPTVIKVIGGAALAFGLAKYFKII